MQRLIKCKNYQFSITQYTKRGKHRPIVQLQKGQNVYGFQFVNKQFFSDFDITHNTFKSKDYQTKFHQLECPQQNNTFSFVFQTRGLSKPSVNFALQKLLLAGSKKYPVRNIIEQMRNRSFNSAQYLTTVNQDYMMFTFNTSLIKDHQNLMQVYADMLFNPLLRQQDFYELIWRFQFTKENKLFLTGELAQEMSTNQHFVQNTIYKLINSHMFGVNNISICKPEELLKLKYSDLVKFYKEIFTISNLTLLNHGDMNNQNILKNWNEIIQNKQIKKYQPLFIEKQIATHHLPKTIQFEHLKQQKILMLSFKIPQNITVQQRVLLPILSYILFDMPDSKFMKFNTPDTPYPNLYGFKDRYFNVGITFLISLEDKENLQKIFIQKQKQIRQILSELLEKNLSNSLIQNCLMHLQSNYYTSNGESIIQNSLDCILKDRPLSSVLSVTSLLQKTMKKYRKENTFENLIKKFLIDNQECLIMRGNTNFDLIDNREFQRRVILKNMLSTMNSSEINKIRNYSPPQSLQDSRILPQINPNQLEFFQDLQPHIRQFGNTKIYYSPCINGVKITLKLDVSDIQEDDIPLLGIFCDSFPKMGIKSMKSDAYNELLNSRINNINMKFETQKMKDNLMKIHIFLTVQFNDRNFEYGFNLLTGLISDFNYENIFQLSKSIQKSASNCFNQISQNVIDMHGLHLAASKSAFAYFQSPIFNARSITSIASDIRRVTNPKQVLMSIKSRFLQIWLKIMQKSRTQILIECKQSRKQIYDKYLQMAISSMRSIGEKANGISIQNFPCQKWLKYFPNYDQQIAFQAFKVPYLQKKSAPTLILSSIINRNIKLYNNIGGCFLYKGALISFIGGSRKKVLQLEDYYRKIQQIDFAKRRIFQYFKRYTVQNAFRSGISTQQAKFFKQAVIATTKEEVGDVLDTYILQQLKKGESSILCVGNRLQNYQPLLKKGWQIERCIQGTSLNMESLSAREAILQLSRYTGIC